MSSGANYMMRRSPSAAGRAPLPAADFVVTNPPPAYEADATEHWRFGTDASSLVGRVNGKTLVLNSGAQTVNYSATDLDAPYDGGLQLTTEFAETADLTVVAVVKKQTMGANNLSAIFATYFGSTGGVVLDQLATGAVYVGAVGTGIPAPGTVYPTDTGGVVSPPAAHASGEYFAFAAVFTSTGWRAKFIEGEWVDRRVSSGVRTIRPAVGCRVGWFVTPINTNIDNRPNLSELIVWNEAKTDDEVDAILERTWLRNLARPVPADRFFTL